MTRLMHSPFPPTPAAWDTLSGFNHLDRGGYSSIASAHLSMPNGGVFALVVSKLSPALFYREDESEAERLSSESRRAEIMYIGPRGKARHVKFIAAGEHARALWVDGDQAELALSDYLHARGIR